MHMYKKTARTNLNYKNINVNKVGSDLGTESDLSKSAGSDRIRIHNTGWNGRVNDKIGCRKGKLHVERVARWRRKYAVGCIEGMSNRN